MYSSLTNFMNNTSLALHCKSDQSGFSSQMLCLMLNRNVRMKLLFKCRITLFAFYCHEGCILLDKRKQAGALLRVSVLWFGALLMFGSSRAAPSTPGSFWWGPSDAGHSESRGSESRGKQDAITTEPESQQCRSFEICGTMQC